MKKKVLVKQDKKPWKSTRKKIVRKKVSKSWNFLPQIDCFWIKIEYPFRKQKTACLQKNVKKETKVPVKNKSGREKCEKRGKRWTWKENIARDKNLKISKNGSHGEEKKTIFSR